MNSLRDTHDSAFSKKGERRSKIDKTADNKNDLNEAKRTISDQLEQLSKILDDSQKLADQKFKATKESEIRRLELSLRVKLLEAKRSAKSIEKSKLIVEKVKLESLANISQQKRNHIELNQYNLQKNNTIKKIESLSKELMKLDEDLYNEKNNLAVAVQQSKTK